METTPFRYEELTLKRFNDFVKALEKEPFYSNEWLDAHTKYSTVAKAMKDDWERYRKQGNQTDKVYKLKKLIKNRRKRK